MLEKFSQAISQIDSASRMKFESTRKAGENIVDRFFISFLVPEISAFKKYKMAPKVAHQHRYLAKLWGETVKLVTSVGLHVSRQIMKISNNLLTTCSNLMKLCRQKVP